MPHPVNGGIVKDTNALREFLSKGGDPNLIPVYASQEDECINGAFYPCFWGCDFNCGPVIDNNTNLRAACFVFPLCPLLLAILPLQVCDLWTNGRGKNWGVNANHGSRFTLLHFAVVYECEDAIRVLIEGGADGKIKSCNPEITPYRLAVMLGKIPPTSAAMELLRSTTEIAEVNEMRRTEQEMMKSKQALANVGNVSINHSKAHVAYVCYEKKTDALSAIHSRLAQTFGADRVFIPFYFDDGGGVNKNDSISTIRERIKNSSVMVLVQTEKILVNPYTLFEIFTALQNGVIIIPITIEGGNYDFPKIKFVLNSDDALGLLEHNNAAFFATLKGEEELTPIREIITTVLNALPYLSTKTYNATNKKKILDEVVGIIHMHL